MSAFEIHRRKRPDFARRFVPCLNQCHGRAGSPRNRIDLGNRNATHIATILDTDTYLCAECAARWTALWPVALEGFTGIQFEEAG